MNTQKENQNKHCDECTHFENNTCTDTPLLINRSPSDKACKFFKDV